MKSKIGLFGFMFLIMFALKLAGPLASTSWWLVTLPLYGPLVFLLVIVIGIMLCGLDKKWGWN